MPAFSALRLLFGHRKGMWPLEILLQSISYLTLDELGKLVQVWSVCWVCCYLLSFISDCSATCSTFTLLYFSFCTLYCIWFNRKLYILDSFCTLLLQQYQAIRSLRSSVQNLLALPSVMSDFGRCVETACTTDSGLRADLFCLL